MGLDYYKILGVSKSASKVEICQAYKELALRYHPSLKHNNENQAYKRFCEVAEAFDILYNDEKRNIYDQHGEQKLKQGILNEKGERGLGNYTLITEPEVIFEKFFGSKNVFEHLLSVGEGQGKSHPIFSSQYGPNANIAAKKVPDLVVPIECLLSELFNGCKKVKMYPKNVLSLDGQSTQTVTETKEVEIPQGRSQSNPIVFGRQGNQQPGEQPSDLIFQIVEINEMGFKRSKSDPADLIYTAQISLIDALDCKAITVKELGGEIVQLHFDEIINPDTERVIEGRGMRREDGSGRGNLIVRFDIDFPEEVPIEKKARIVELLTV